MSFGVSRQVFDSWVGCDFKRCSTPDIILCRLLTLFFINEAESAKEKVSL